MARALDTVALAREKFPGAPVSLDALGRRVMVAWNQSDEALVAVRRAMPILRAAEAVEIAVVDPSPYSPEGSDPGGKLCQMLTRHGVKAEIAVLAKTLPTVTEVLTRRAAETGIYDIQGGGAKRRVPHFDDLLFLGASISRYPLEGYREKCDTSVVLGTRFAKKPIELKIPITIAGMSFGALSGPAKEALGRGASEVVLVARASDEGFVSMVCGAGILSPTVGALMVYVPGARRRILPLCKVYVPFVPSAAVTTMSCLPLTPLNSMVTA